MDLVPVVPHFQSSSHDIPKAKTQDKTWHHQLKSSMLFRVPFKLEKHSIVGTCMS